MAENQDGQEKSQEPTGKRIEDAKKKGQIARSKELATMLVTVSGVTLLWMMGAYYANRMQALFSDHLSLSRAEVLDPLATWQQFSDALGAAVWLLVPIFGITVVSAIVGSIALGGFNFSSEALQPKFEKMDPIKGLGKLFSAKSLVELIKAIAKFLLIATATALLIDFWMDDLLALASMDVEQGIGTAFQIIARSALLLTLSLGLIAAVDVPFQLYDHKKQLMMTQQEVRDELKQTEGRPEIKGKIRQMQREMAQKRMMANVPNADVIVTNPTHYAVALQYDMQKMNAPKLLAKGEGLVALNIRKVGMEHQVTVVQSPVLARAIYFNAEIDHFIPAELYRAVALLLAYVYQLKAYRREGGEKPVLPNEFPLPKGIKTQK